MTRPTELNPTTELFPLIVATGLLLFGLATFDCPRAVAPSARCCGAPASVAPAARYQSAMTHDLGDDPM
jgi:hypothetical protein